MPNPIVGLIAGAATIGSAAIQSKAAKSAANTQAEASQAGIDEQRRQFDLVQELLKPYVDQGVTALPEYASYGEFGKPALDEQAAILGLRGPEEQARAIGGIESSPLYTDLARQGEDAILQNASATGGLRGGNTQGALAQFRPQLLKQLIDEQYGRLGGIAGLGATVNDTLTKLGQSSAAGVGNAGITTGTNIAELLGQQGAARAGGSLGTGQAFGGALNNAAFLAPLLFSGGGGFAPSAGLVADVAATQAANPAIF